MSLFGRSLLSVESLDLKSIDSIFQRALLFQKSGFPRLESNRVIAPMFFEPSTRTDLSFQMAALRLGYKVLDFEADKSSLSKGETLLDTLKTVDAMNPDLFVIRHGFNEKLSELAPEINAPIINAGEGASGHPTQALLDAFTIFTERGQVEGEKVLLVGDIAHSRVARSNLKLLTMMGAEVRVCAPQGWYPQDFEAEGVERFEGLSDGLEWATVCMGLRIQRERHDSSENIEDWVLKNQLNTESLKVLRADGLIMHPGPFNLGVEMSADVLKDSRCKIFQQKANGVWVRAALMFEILEEES